MVTFEACFSLVKPKQYLLLGVSQLTSAVFKFVPIWESAIPLAPTAGNGQCALRRGLYLPSLLLELPWSFLSKMYPNSLNSASG